METSIEASRSGFEFLPADIFENGIEIYSPFSKPASRYFSNKQLIEITDRKSESIRIIFDKIDKDEKIVLLEEVKSFLKNTRTQMINNYHSNIYL